MRYRTFLTFNVAGGVLWGTAVVLAGYIAGASYTRVEQAFGKDAAVVVLVLAVAAFVVWHVRRRHSEKAPSED
jgi:membrane protein DedA with SNARE-associated domain